MLSPEEQDGRRKEISIGEPELMRRLATPKENSKPTEQQGEVLSEAKTSEASRSPEHHRQIKPALDHLKTLSTENSLQTAVMVRVGTEEEEEEDEEKLSEQSQNQIIKDSYDLTTSKLGNLVSVNSLSSPPQSPSTSPPCPPQLPDGSHFMCV